MGTDISSHSGILVEVPSVLKLINSKNKRSVIACCAEHYATCVADLKKYPNCEWRASVEEWFRPLSEIPSVVSVTTLRELLDRRIAVIGEPSKYDVDTHVKFSEELTDLWRLILDDAIETELPHLVSIDAWGSARLNGWDVPLGEARFVFDDDDCYERKLSVKGKALQKLAGHCNITEWTHYSV